MCLVRQRGTPRRGGSVPAGAGHRAPPVHALRDPDRAIRDTDRALRNTDRGSRRRSAEGAVVRRSAAAQVEAPSEEGRDRRAPGTSKLTPCLSTWTAPEG